MQHTPRLPAQPGLHIDRSNRDKPLISEIPVLLHFGQGPLHGMQRPLLAMLLSPQSLTQAPIEASR